MKQTQPIFQIIMVAAMLVVFASCKGGYSFTGASISPDVKTIQISYFPNRASNVNPSLSSTFTEALKDRFLSQTSLTIVNLQGDLTIEGEITDYRVTPQAYQGNETAALNRLTINVRVKFTNTKDPSKSYDTQFSRYADFESSKNLASVESQLITEIVDQLTEDIFNKAVVNW